MEIIRGSNISEEIRKGLKEANQEEGICPKLAIILVGGRPLIMCTLNEELESI